MTRAVFAEHNQRVDIGKLRQFGIDEVVVPAVDSPLFNPQELNALEEAGFETSILVAWNWFGKMTGAEFARKCDALLRSLTSASPNPGLWADIEVLDYLNQTNFATFMAEFAVEWRRLRKTRRTIWTVNPMQGGCFNGKGAERDTILGANIGINIQHYGGNMEPFAADVDVKDFALYGFPVDRMTGAYDARALPEHWDGLAWTSARLP